MEEAVCLLPILASQGKTLHVMNCLTLETTNFELEPLDFDLAGANWSWLQEDILIICGIGGAVEHNL